MRWGFLGGKRALSVVAALAFALAVLSAARSASAIPAFARRYETSCFTCHVTFPRLNPFGEAFRRNAYRMPAGGDATLEKEERVSLGAEAYKDLWPKEGYPGQLPGKIPLSISFDGKIAFGSEFESHLHGASSGSHTMHSMTTESEGHHDTVLRFDDLDARVLLLTAGPIGDIASFFASAGLHTAEMGVERANVTLLPFGPTALQLKVGRFEPSLHGVSIHRGLLGHALRLTTDMVENSMFSPEMSLRGVEATGLVEGRLAWFAGAVENAAPIAGIEKDLYMRAELKLGGMRLDGVGAVASGGTTERSLLIGFMGYHGRSVIDRPNPAYTPFDRIVRAGVDAHVNFDNLLVDVVFARQRNDAPVKGNVDQRVTDMVYAEATYLVLPWLFPTGRFELTRMMAPGTMPGEGADYHTRWLGLFGLTATLRPNLFIRAECAIGAEPEEHTSFRFAALDLMTAL